MSPTNILNLLEDIEQIFVKCSVKNWSSRISRHAGKLREAIASNNDKWVRDELDAIKKLYGGMGSFTDVFITPEAGHVIFPSEVKTINSTLQGLQSRLYDEIENETRTLNQNNLTT